jgi:hypothetical protein
MRTDRHDEANSRFSKMQRLKISGDMPSLLHTPLCRDPQLDTGTNLLFRLRPKIAKSDC